MGSACCAVGARPDAAEIDAALRSATEAIAAGKDPPEGLNALARRTGASKTSIIRHRDRCLGLAHGPVQEMVDHPADRSEPAGPASDAPLPPPAVQSRARAVPTPVEPAAAPSEAKREPSRAMAPPASKPDEPDLPPCPPDRASRVEAIEDIMLGLRWEKGKTGPRLAAAWGLSLSAIENYSSEASRNITRNADPQAMRSKLATTLDRAIQQAILTGELKALASLAKTYADMLGLIQSGKVQVNILQAPPVVDFIGSAVAFMEALCPEASELIDAWVAAARDDVDGARSDPAGWLERRRGTITVEADT